MKPIPLGFALLAAALFGGVVGSLITRAATASSAAPPTPPASIAARGHAHAAQTRANGGNHAPDGYGATGTPPNDSERMIQRARRDPAYLRELLRDYSFETELDKRGALLAVLQAVANDEVLRMARQLADSGDPESRRNGLDLLKAFSLDQPQVRELLSRQLQAERDPAMLKQLVDMLAPTVVASEDAAPLLERLSELRQHPDPAVRASAVVQSVQWNKHAGNEEILQRAMLDPDLSVRQAAIAGINASSTRSDRLKDSLLALAADPQTDAETRNSAVFALQNFAMNRGEYALYRKAAAQAVDGDGHEREYPGR
ncbi:HEAT repeat domain-containing protein [Lysobacter capsici]|uniref:HEAT repeat domain-containing protein n=1 Tax=Lysobacter capsici TaxID=435897 RepID=UPI00177F07E4|nr:HEAT repeat domain-containing protein [Lysobacter capsici]UOF14079.1 HEAT repeat domain-containing protein [Lysobacter capsici]